MRYYGIVGYVSYEETAPGVWTNRVIERPYGGDVTRRTMRWQNGEHLNDNIDVNNVISIVADPYALEHFGNIRYVTWMNSKWKVTSIDVQYPRINITIGGVYNGEEQN